MPVYLILKRAKVNQSRIKERASTVVSFMSEWSCLVAGHPHIRPGSVVQLHQGSSLSPSSHLQPNRRLLERVPSRGECDNAVFYDAKRSLFVKMLQSFWQEGFGIVLSLCEKQ
jgi:hypothetical protein